MATLNVAVRATPVLMSEEATFGVVCHTTLCSIFGDTAFLCVVGIHHRSRQATPAVLPPSCSTFTLTGRQLLSLLRMQMTHYLVQLPVLPIISSTSFYPNIITNNPYHLRSRTHSFKLSAQHDNRNFIDRMLFRQAHSVSV